MYGLNQSPLRSVKLEIQLVNKLAKKVEALKSWSGIMYKNSEMGPLVTKTALGKS